MSEKSMTNGTVTSADDRAEVTLKKLLCPDLERQLYLFHSFAEVFHDFFHDFGHGLHFTE